MVARGQKNFTIFKKWNAFMIIIVLTILNLIIAKFATFKVQSVSDFFVHYQQ